VLLLEDDLDLAQNLSELLATEGYEVTHTLNGAEGLKALMKREFHVILCDMVMPSFPGDMFYVAVKKARPELCQRFIFMTGHRADRRIDEFIRAVRGLVLWKPFEMYELLSTTRHVLERVAAQSARQIYAA
jgi:DNA-binding NtrC family response regulator